ncbi:hypothetical protein LJY18_06675 [Pseudomonas sp. MMS21-TM103]|uniref:hypothetical protein n=1 Tax=Pseudomonas sp. MMS21 TM103 TaxID=2886506 RepID=UPI001EDF2C2F|nr:hypothetical protein [Pseudomonas sp. MMS21 TM103]MCG4452991.1 hypothetical protein [Pseudomonas sp. MMS21 TM103]
MSRRHFDLASSDKYLLIGSAFLLALIGLVLSRDAEVAASHAAMLAPALPIAAATGGVVMVRRLQQISSDSLAPTWSDSSRKVSWVF